MKKMMNFSKLAVSTLILSSVFVACSEEITDNTVNTHYTANAGSIKTAGNAVDLGLSVKWADRNVGAASEKDNGILFVWGDITGTQITPSNVSTYTDVTSQTSLSDLFDMYKGANEETGVICDTTNIVKLDEPKLIDLTFIGDTTGLDSAARAAIDYQKMVKINSFLEDKLTDLINKGNTGFLEAYLTNMEFEIIYNWDGSKFITRLPNLNEIFKLGNGVNPTAQDTLNYYQKFKYEQVSNLVIDKIGTTDVQYYKSGKANGNSEIKDQFGVKQRDDYTGGDISGAPIYSIIADAKLDPATANWGADWQMPTSEQLKELMEKCTWEFTGTGYTVTGPNGNSIFLPAAGYRYENKWYGNGNAGYYASGEIWGTYHFPSMAEQVNGSKGAINGNEDMPRMLIFQHGQYNSLGIYDNLSSSYGISIRPVAK
jgi:hypothetical protein